MQNDSFHTPAHFPLQNTQVQPTDTPPHSILKVYTYNQDHLFVRPAPISPTVMELCTQTHISVTSPMLTCRMHIPPNTSPWGIPLRNTRDSSYGRVPHRGSHEQFTLKTYVSVFLVIFFALEFCMYDWWKIARIRFSSSSLTIRKYIQTLVKRTRLPFPVPLFDGPSWWCEVISSKRRRKASAKGICIHVSRNVLFRQFVASCLVFAGVILSLLRLGHLANQSA